MNKKRQKNSPDLGSRKKVTIIEDATLNPCYTEPDFRIDLSIAYRSKKSFKSENGAYAIEDPFPCFVLPNFITSKDFLVQLQRELNGLDIPTKDNDLYHFRQSNDLNSESSPYIKKFRELLNKDVLAVINEMTRIPLTETVDLTCSMFCQTDYLLCHDDELEGRRIAFIFYLVPRWNLHDGGTLDLFNSENGQPTNIATSLRPKFNNFVFFEVSPVSFHQVAEVLVEKKRLSLSGWFHGPSIKSSASPKTDLLLTVAEAQEFKGDIHSWINPIYLKPSVQVEIRKLFEEKSEIELHNFLNDSKFLEISKALNENSKWKSQGPPNKRNFESCFDLPIIVKECVEALQSQEMCLILSNLTGLALHSLAEVESSDDSDSTDDDYSSSSLQPESESAKIPCMADVCSTLRKWSHGCYTLLHDQETKSGLDGILYFNCEDYNDSFGGCTSYIAKDDGSELLKVTPKLNSYALVYKDETTVSFVKYINNEISEIANPFFHDISIAYFERTS